MHSLKLRLTLAFLFVSLISVAILAAAVGQTNSSEFDRYVLDQMRSDFITQATQHYTNVGSWTGFADRYRRTDPSRPGPTPDPAALPPQVITGTVPFRRDNLFVLADAQGLVVVPVGSFRTGDRVPAAELDKGTPVEVNGQVVGTVFTPIPLWPRDPREDAYLARTTQGLVAAALAATVMGLLLGLLLANNLTRPLRELTAATRAMSRGDLNQKVTVRSRDELGELATSFNQMSEVLTRSTALRR